MKPIRIALFLTSVFLVLALISLVVKSHEWKVKGFTVKIPSLSSFLEQPKPHQYKDISHIIELSTQLTDSIKPTVVSDTVKGEKDTPDHINGVPTMDTDSLRNTFVNIQYPSGSDSLLYPVFKELGSLVSQEKLIRILHYGDSQIEGDRITSYIRNQLQTRFGGYGIGMFPVIASNPGAVPYFYEISDTWKRYSPLPGSEQSATKRYGALVNFATLAPDKKNSYKGWIELIRPNTSVLRAQRSQICRVFYGFNQTPMMVEVKQGEKMVDAEIYPSSASMQVARWDISSPRNITISFTCETPPEIYGIALDGYSGIAMDNIPLRGSSGTEFTKIDFQFLKNFYRQLQVKMMILQFGANVVPNVVGNYNHYEKLFYNQLITLKKALPNAPLLVIGVGDVSRKGENGYESYPNIEKIRDAQRNAAFAAGCAFWDMYAAMGGHNSMPSWVFANPPLAQKDFVHLSPIGAKIIGELFYRSFMQEYDKYQIEKDK